MATTANHYAGPPAETVELDLFCERERWAAVHILRWTTDRQGKVTSKECICKSCDHGANSRSWPTKLELQDAGAASNVPRDIEPPKKPYSLFG